MVTKSHQVFSSLHKWLFFDVYQIQYKFIKPANDIATFVIICFPLPLSAVTRNNAAVSYILSVAVTVSSSVVIAVSTDFSGRPYVFRDPAIIGDETIYFIAPHQEHYLLQYEYIFVSLPGVFNFSIYPLFKIFLHGQICCCRRRHLLFFKNDNKINIMDPKLRHCLYFLYHW